METLKLSPANQALLANKQKNNDEPKTDIVVQKNSKDTFTKTAKLTSGGVIAGGFIGVLKERLKPKNIPNSLTAQYEDWTNPVGAHMRKKTDDMWGKAANTLKRAVNKMLDSQELTEEEASFIDELGLIKQDDVKYLSNSEYIKEYIKKITEQNSYDADAYFGALDISYPHSGLAAGLPRYGVLKDRINDFLEGAGKYKDNEAFIDYLNSRFYSDRTYKIITNNKTTQIRYSISDLCGDDEVASEASYSFKEIINHAKQNKKHSVDLLEIITDKPPEHCDTPIVKFSKKISEIATRELEVEAKQLKDTAIKKFKNKQLLKSAGIGAGIIGAITLVATLVCNKINKQNNN